MLNHFCETLGLKYYVGMHGKKIRKCSNQIISCICIEVAKDAEFKFGNIKKKKKYILTSFTKSCCSKLYDFIPVTPLTVHHSILFYSILFYSILLYYILSSSKLLLGSTFSSTLLTQ